MIESVNDLFWDSLSFFFSLPFTDGSFYDIRCAIETVNNFKFAVCRLGIGMHWIMGPYHEGSQRKTNIRMAKVKLHWIFISFFSTILFIHSHGVSFGPKSKMSLHSCHVIRNQWWKMCKITISSDNFYWYLFVWKRTTQIMATFKWFFILKT